MKFDKNGWLYPDSSENKIHEIKDSEILELIELGKEEKNWQKMVRKEVDNRDKVNLTQGQILIDYFRMKNTSGTITDFPFGQKMITFDSTRHFFRGEKQIYAKSIPTLNRKLDNKSIEDQELYRAIANLRIEAFSRFLWNFKVVPFWEATLSDVNYKALAQHYGFETHLLDLTNDFNVALFFATCKYDEKLDKYVPLTKNDIEKNENTKYGVIYHSPNWTLDYFSAGSIINPKMLELFQNNDKKIYEIDSGKFDGIAFQIGYQPLMRCSMQSGYVLPMRNSVPLQNDTKFEKLYFKQSVELSERVFKMMDEGKKVFPEEGINAAKEKIDEIKNLTIFPEEDIELVYSRDINKEIFPSLKGFKDKLLGFKVNGKNIMITKISENFNVNEEILNNINKYYDNKNLLDYVGGKIFSRPSDIEYFKQKYIYIYGKGI